MSTLLDKWYDIEKGKCFFFVQYIIKLGKSLSKERCCEVQTSDLLPPPNYFVSH